MANQNFRVKTGLEVGTGVTISAGIVTASTFSGNATNATYAVTAGVSTYSGVSGFSTFSGYSNVSGVSTFSEYANAAGIATYTIAAGVSTFSGYSNVSGIATSVISGIASVTQLQVSGVSTFRTLTVQDNSSPEKLATIGVSSIGVGTGLLVEVSTNSSGQIISFNSSGIAGGNAYGYGNGDVVTLDGPGSPTSKVRIGIAQVTPPNGLAAILTSQSSLPAGSGYTPNQTNVLVSTTNITPRVYSLPAAKLPTTAFTPIPTTVLVGANSDQTLTNKIIIAGAGTSTGTASQTLQVTGGAYVSDNLGIGSTNPTSKLHVVGNTLVVGVLTSTTVNDSIGNVRAVPQNAQTSAYILAASDVGKHISITTGGVTVNASIFSVGDAVTIYNNSSSNQTITQGASVTLRQAGTANTGNRTLAQYGVCTVLCIVGGATPTFVISGAGLS